MASKNGEGPAATGNGAWKGFVDLKLPEGVTWDLIAAELPAGGLAELLGDLTGQGYKVSVGYSPHNDGYVVSLTGTALAGANSGYTMTTWSDRLERALGAAWYKQEVVGRGKAWGSWQQKGMFEV